MGEGVAPDQIKSTYFDQNTRFRERAGMQDAPESAVTILKTRPVCAYPEVAIYKGSGDMKDAASRPGRESASGYFMWFTGRTV